MPRSRSASSDTTWAGSKPGAISSDPPSESSGCVMLFSPGSVEERQNREGTGSSA